MFCLLIQQTVIESQEQFGGRFELVSVFESPRFRGCRRVARVLSETLVGRRVSFVNEFGAQGKVSVASQCDSLFTSGPPRPGAPSWPKINVGHADMYL